MIKFNLCVTKAIVFHCAALITRIVVTYGFVSNLWTTGLVWQTKKQKKAKVASFCLFNCQTRMTTLNKDFGRKSYDKCATMNINQTQTRSTNQSKPRLFIREIYFVSFSGVGMLMRTVFGLVWWISRALDRNEKIKVFYHRNAGNRNNPDHGEITRLIWSDRRTALR